MAQGSDSQSNLLEFFMLVGKLKHLKRTGWVMKNIEDCESVACHMYRMGIMAFLINDGSSQPCNRDRCIKMVLVHDLAESLVGDITPHCGISKDEKYNREMAAMEKISTLVGGKVGQEFLELFKEYESQTTPESKIVKDLDKFDMILQAYEYEKKSKDSLNLQDFFHSTEGTFESPTVLKWVEELNALRSSSKSTTPKIGL